MADIFDTLAASSQKAPASDIFDRLAASSTPAGTPGGVLPGVPAAVPVPAGLQGAPAVGPNANQAAPSGSFARSVFGQRPVMGPVSTAASHLWNDVSGIPKAALAPVTDQEKTQDNADWLGNPVTRAAYRTLIEPTANAVSSARTNFKNGNFDAGMQDAEDAVPIVGPVARQFSNDAANGGLTSALAGAGADVLAAKTAGKVIDAATNPVGMGQSAQDAAAARVNRYMGTTAKDMRNGANPGRGVINDTPVPSSRSALVRNIQSAQGKIGQQLGDTIQAADSNPNAPVITLQQLRPAIEDPVYTRTGQVIGPGGNGNVAPLGNLLDSFNETAPDATAPIYGPNAPATVTPSNLWRTIRNVDSNTKFSTDPQVEGVNEVGRDIRGNLRTQLETADPNIKPLSQRYSDLRTGGNVLARKIAPHSGVPTSLTNIIGRTLDSAPLQVGLGKLQNAVGRGVAGAGKTLGLPNTGLNPGWPAGAAVVYGAPGKTGNQNEGNVEDSIEQPQAAVPDPGDESDGDGDQEDGSRNFQEKHIFRESTTVPVTGPKTIGSIVNALPAPLQRVANETGARFVPKESNSSQTVASVDADNPNDINIEDGERFAKAAPQTAGHELVHTWQGNLPPHIQAQIPADNPKDPYNYGGTEGLTAARANGERLWNKPHEQAAAIVQYYISQGGANAPKAVKDAYEPWLNDMNATPLSAIMPTEPGQQGINVTPRAPEAQPETYQETQTFAPGDPAPGEAPAITHPLGSVTGIDHDSGLPIVKRGKPQLDAGSANVQPKVDAAAKAGAKVAAEPALKPEVQDATNAPQPVGKTDPESGRQISQPSDNPATNQALATAAMPEFNAGLKDALKGIPGATLAADRAAKNPKRLAEKINDEDQPAETVSDYGAAQVSVDSPKAKDDVIAAVKKQFPKVLREDDNFDKGDKDYGYRNYSLQVQMPNGASMELQLPKEVLDANAAEHGNYKAAREAAIDGDTSKEAENSAAAKTKNDAAMAKFNDRNNTSQKLSKGAAVTLPDGSRGTISYLDPNMKIARVTKSGGGSVTLAQSKLKTASSDTPVPKGHVLVSEHVRKLPGKK